MEILIKVAILRENKIDFGTKNVFYIFPWYYSTM